MGEKKKKIRRCHERRKDIPGEGIAWAKPLG